MVLQSPDYHYLVLLALVVLGLYAGSALGPSLGAAGTAGPLVGALLGAATGAFVLAARRARDGCGARTGGSGPGAARDYRTTRSETVTRAPARTASATGGRDG